MPLLLSMSRLPRILGVAHNLTISIVSFLLRLLKYILIYIYIYLHYLYIKGDPGILPNIIIILSLLHKITEKSLLKHVSHERRKTGILESLTLATKWSFYTSTYPFLSQLIGQK